MKVKHRYECLGCKKVLNTYKEYPDNQWICLKCRDKVKVTLKCSVCGDDFKVSWDTYRMKDHNIPWRCRSCNDNYRNEVYDNKSDEEKQAFVESQRARSKGYWANLSDEEREKDSDRRKKLWKRRKETGEAEHILSPMKAGRARWWNSLSDEEQFIHWSYMDAGRAKWWESLTAEEQHKHMEFPHKGFSDWYNSLSEEEQIKFMTPIWNGNDEFWNRMISNPDEYKNWKIKFAEGYREYLSTVDPYNRNVTPNKNELAFIDNLNLYGIKYIFQYPSLKIHPDFRKLFPYNPVTKADLVDPTHMWDFIIHTLDGNVLVDVDGSMHFNDTYIKTHPYTKVVYKELDYKKFNDSQRPYQTDGLEAYAILCYDDNLTNDTLVENINTHEKITFKEFMSILIWMTLTEKERKEILKSI